MSLNPTKYTCIVVSLLACVILLAQVLKKFIVLLAYPRHS
jgi:hypothetical protein